MAYISVELRDGAVGDIEAALIRAGCDRLGGAELMECIIESQGPIRFRDNKLSKAGVDPAVLVRELRAIGLVVRWTGESMA